ncbi:MAG: hypothetical protein WBX15_07515 [Thermoanaerobaculia bacterium]
MRTLSTIGFSVAALLLPVAGFADATVSHQFQTSSPAEGVLRISIEIPVAEIEIVNGDAATISVSGTASREVHDEGDRVRLQEIVDDTAVRINRRGSRMTIVPAHGPAASSRWARNNRTELTVRITIPRHVNLEVHQKVGDLSVSGEYANMDLNLRVGNVTVTAPRQQIREVNAGARVGKTITNIGDRIVTKEGLFAGRMQFFNEGGKATLRVTVEVGEIRLDLSH